MRIQLSTWKLGVYLICKKMKTVPLFPLSFLKIIFHKNCITRMHIDNSMALLDSDPGILVYFSGSYLNKEALVIQHQGSISERQLNTVCPR